METAEKESKTSIGHNGYKYAQKRLNTIGKTWCKGKLEAKTW